MADNLIPQHKRLACGDAIDTPAIENPFKQVQTCDGTKKELSDGQRKQTTQRYQG